MILRSVETSTSEARTREAHEPPKHTRTPTPWPSRLRFVAAACAVIGAFGCSSKDDSEEVIYEKPQILPDNSPICLNYDKDPVYVGDDRARNVLLRNDGRQQLVITDVTIVDNSRGYFRVEGVSPSTVDTRDSAVARFHYEPEEPGWDTAFLEVKSNAENYPTLRLFILALGTPVPSAHPENDPPYDPGEKPAAAYSTEGVEACAASNAP